MIVYSVAISLKKEDGPPWKVFMIEKHLEDVVNTGCFTHAELRIEKNENPDEVIYIGEYFANSQEDLDRYYQEFADAMRQDVLNHFSGKFSAKRKVFEVVAKHV